MKSLLAFVLLVACAAQVYSVPLLPVEPGYGLCHHGYLSRHVDYATPYAPFYGNLCHHRVPNCGCKVHANDLYPCPYRPHGPCVNCVKN